MAYGYVHVYLTYLVKSITSSERKVKMEGVNSLKNGILNMQSKKSHKTTQTLFVTPF